MRLAFLYRRLGGAGGTEGDLYRTTAALAARGHDVHLFCAEPRAAPPPGVRLHRVRIVRAGRVVRLLSFAWAAPRAAARVGGWDVVVGFGRTPRQDLVRCGGGTHRAYLDSMRASGARGRSLGPYHRAVLALEAAQYRAGNFRRILAVSRRVRDEIASGYRVGAECIRVVYNGVDLQRFAPTHRPTLGAATRRDLGIPSDAPTVLAVGSGFRRKGVDALLRLWKQGPPAAACLVVVGSDERLPAYRRLARQPELQGRVIVAGPQPQIERYYAAADAVVVPSLQEAFGNVVLEALAAGVPVVTSARVGAAELLTGALRDLMVDDPCDILALRNRLETALGTHRDELCRAARGIAECYPWGQHFAEIETLLEETATAS